MTAPVPRSTAWPAGSFAPRPGRAPVGRLLRAQTRVEALLTLRRGESLLLTLGIPLGVLVLAAAGVLGDGGRAERLDDLVPGLLALCVLATAFTGQAISTGFERSYGVLKRLGGTALTRPLLLAAKVLAVLAVVAVQVAVLVPAALLLGWRPSGGLVGGLVAAALLLLGVATFTALGLLLGGTLRAEAVLALANLVFLVLLVAGGLVVPLEDLGPTAESVLGLLPTAALADGLRAVLADGGAPPASDVALLLGWGGAAAALASRLFRFTG